MRKFNRGCSSGAVGGALLAVCVRRQATVSKVSAMGNLPQVGRITHGNCIRPRSRYSRHDRRTGRSAGYIHRCGTDIPVGGMYLERAGAQFGTAIRPIDRHNRKPYYSVATLGCTFHRCTATRHTGSLQKSLTDISYPATNGL